MKQIKLWLDDIRPAPKGWFHCTSVNQTKRFIRYAEKRDWEIILDIDHDLGDYAIDGGDGIELVKWMAGTERFYPIEFHTMNPVGLQNMKAIVNRYWK